jgi:hypothetical protein
MLEGSSDDQTRLAGGSSNDIVWRKQMLITAVGGEPASVSTPIPLESQSTGDSNSDVLIDENRVSIRVHHHKTTGTSRAFVCLVLQVYSLRLELALEFAHVCESI